jgi:hypothetical protein
MPYRSNTTALLDEQSSIERELATLRGPDSVALFHPERIDQLERRLEKLSAVLGARRSKTQRVVLKVQQASPCPASWEDMPGNERVRHCGKCRKNVYNFSALTADEAHDLLIENEGKVCARLFRRWDGSILTSDCPRQRLVRAAQVAGGIAFGAATLAGMGAIYPEGRYMGAVGDAGTRIIEDRSRVRVNWSYDLEDVPADLGASTYNRRDPPRER